MQERVMNDALRFSVSIVLTIATCSTAAWLSLPAAGDRGEAASREPARTKAGPRHEPAREAPLGAWPARGDDVARTPAAQPGGDA
jgi:hypothetical protein